MKTMFPSILNFIVLYSDTFSEILTKWCKNGKKNIFYILGKTSKHLMLFLLINQINALNYHMLNAFNSFRNDPT